MGSEKHSKKCAITICGPPRAGKTSFANRLLNGSFPNPQDPQKSNFAIEFFSFPDNALNITVANKPAKDLLKLKVLRNGQFKEADLILILIDAIPLPPSQELEDYFKLASGEDLASKDKLIYKNKSIHLVVNKMDELDEPAREAIKKSVAVLLEVEGRQNINAHYISTKNNDGIPELRGQLGIPHPSHHPILKSETDGTFLTKKITSEVVLAITLGVVAGVIAGFLGGPPLGIAVGMGVAVLTLNATTVANFLREKFSKNNEEAMPEPMKSSEETLLSKELIIDPSQQQPGPNSELELAPQQEPEPVLEPESGSELELELESPLELGSGSELKSKLELKTEISPELEKKPKLETKLEQKSEPLQKKPIKLDFMDIKSNPALAKRYGLLFEPPKDSLAEKQTPQTTPDPSKKTPGNNEP